MKCKYCNAEVAPNARFCTTCGGDLSKLDKCARCGEFIEKSESVCPHCGTEQPQIIQRESGSKKGIWIILAIVLLCVIGGAGYYFFDKSGGRNSYVAASDTIELDADSEEREYDIHSVDGIKVRLTEILSEALKMQDGDAIHSFFSMEYQKLYDKVEEFDNAGLGGEIGFWNGNIWDGGQEGNPDVFSIIQLNSSSETNALAEVKLTIQKGEWKSENIVSIDLIFENGNWFIDDVGGHKTRMKEYIGENQDRKEIIDAYTNILNDYAKKGKDSTYGYLFFLYDITGDGLPELWIQVEGDRDDELNCKLLVYKFKDGATSKIYQKSVGHPAHHSFIEVNDCVCLSFEHMGSSQIEKYEYKNGEIQTKVIYSKESYDDKEDSEKPFGKELETYEITDRERLTYL